MAKPPIYMEAYPVLSVTDAVDHVRAGHSLCRWRDVDADEVGQASIIMPSRTQMRIRHSRFRNGYLEFAGGDATFEISWQALGENGRPLFVCPSCQRRVVKIVLRTAGWRCRRCSGLRVKSQTGPKTATDLSHRKDLLDEQLAGGRAPGVWTGTYRDLQEKRREIVRHLEQPRRQGFRDAEVFGPEWLEPEITCQANGGVLDADPPRERLRYWEAFPSISSIEARRARGRGENLCLWRDHKERIIGGAELDASDPREVRIRYAVQRTRTQDGGAGEIVLAVTEVGSNDDNKRRLFLCPLCQQARVALALVSGDWACRECHRLDY